MDMKALLKQAQKMQRELVETENELKAKLYTSSVGGGIVKAEVNGNAEITKLDINKELLNENHKEEVQDLIMMAVNDALLQMNNEKEKVMGSMTGGVKFPGVF